MWWWNLPQARIFELNTLFYKSFDYLLQLEIQWFLEIKALRNQGLLQTLEKCHVLQTLIYFSRSAPWIYTTNLKKMEYAIFGLKMIIKSGRQKIFF